MSDSDTTSREIEELYRSDNFLIINKHYDVRINSDDPAHTVTVETQLRQKYPHLIDTKVQHGFRFPHRLDYATSGVLCLALNKKAAGSLSVLFQQRKTVKHYLALVRGHVCPPAGDSLVRHVDVALCRDSSVTDVCKMCTADSPSCEGALPAQTDIVTLQHGTYKGLDASKLLLIPHTGRTHQLRVHCLHLGHPIVGDFTYSNRTDTDPHRMMLHAYRLMAPLSGEPFDVKTTDPFTTECDPLWTPSKTFVNYEQFVSGQSPMS